MQAHAIHRSRPHLKQQLIGLGLLLATSVACLPAAQAASIDKTAKIAPGLYELVAAPASNSVYVASIGQRGANNANVFILDANTLATKGKINVSATPAFGLGINHKSGLIYATATTKGKVIVIDPATQTVLASIASSDKDHLREVAVDSIHNIVYVTALGRKSSSIWVIDGNTNSLLQTISLKAPMVTGIAVDPAHQRLFVSSLKTQQIIVIDTQTGLVTDKFAAGGKAPINIAYDATGKRLFVANKDSGTLSVLNADSGKLLATTPTGAGALDVQFDSNRNRVYVTNRKDGTLSVIDATSYKLLDQLTTGTYPQSIAINTQTGQVYVSNKAKQLPRNAPKDATPIKDPNGDTVTLITP